MNQRRSGPRPAPLSSTGEDWWLTAVLPNDSDAWDLVADGYDTAARLIAEHVARTRAENDFLIWPFMFLVRHATEVRLKAILVLGGRLEGGTPPDLTEDYGHNLGKAWRDARLICQKAFPKDPDQSLRRIGRFVAEISEIDLGGDTFRYPATAKGQPSIESPRHLSFRVLWERYTEASELLDGAISGVMAQLDFENDMRQDYTGA